MILQALNSYYECLAADPAGDIAPFGFSRQKISFCVVLNADGTLHEIADVRTQEGKKQVPLSLVVPGNAKPSGSGINPCFLWDNPAYLLGYKPDDTKPERTLQSFEAFRQRHLDVESAVDDPEFSAVCTFLKNWTPESAGSCTALIDIGTGFGVFRIRATDHYVHEREAVHDWWKQQHGSEDDASAEGRECLVTGEQAPLARLHEPKIKGVWGAQSSGAAIVSFNLDAFESYGKSQSLNAPVSEQVAFQYCTALNRLLADDHRRVQIGDASTVFWTAQPTEAENLLPWAFEPTREAEDDAQANRIQSLLSRISHGEYPGEIGDPQTPFYVLGLSPNAARISVRFWWVSTLRTLVENLHEHFADLSIDRSDRDPEFPSVWRILRETVRESKDLPPLLGGALIRSVLMGTRYPSLLLSALIRRIRADSEVRYFRAATIKAILNRNSRLGIDPLQKELDMSLDPERTEPSYQMGRLFAELEKTQEDAQPGINDTIKDRYFGSASATPASVFPRLIKLSQHHLGKFDKRKRTYHDKRIQGIADRLHDFPTHLSLRDQGLFAIGYYHQRQNIFTKKSDVSTTSSQEEE